MKKLAVIVVCVSVLALSVCALVGCSGNGNFEKYGIKADMEVNKKFEFNATCEFDVTKTTVGKAEIITKKTFESAPGYEAKTDYEWQQLTMRVTFDDENAWNYGYLYEWVFSNYEDMTIACGLTYDDKGTAKFTVPVSGIPYDCTITKTTEEFGWTSSQGTHEKIVQVTWVAHIPKDYENMVYGVMDGALASTTAYKAQKTLNEYYSEDQFALLRFK